MKIACACLASLVAILATSGVADESPLLDCPMRDAPYSLESPFIDLLLSAEARAVLEADLPELFAAAPAFFLATETPSFASIMTLTLMSRIMPMPVERFSGIGEKLAAIEVTNADRRARCARYDNEAPELDISADGVNILVFDKINGFDHGPSVGAATRAVKTIAKALGWTVNVTGKGGAFTPELLSHFDAVVWNNNSGDVLTLTQRQAFEDYMHGGGGFVGIHGAGGDSIYFWDWYVDELLGAQFIGHPMEPQFQDAQVRIEASPSGIGSVLAPGWVMNDEWYSFARSARDLGANVVANLDESTYSPRGPGGHDLSMGDDHPIAWSRCVADGRAFYSAIGHRLQVYEVAENMALLKDGLVWAAGKGASSCEAGAEVQGR